MGVILIMDLKELMIVSEQELEELNNVQANLKAEKDYQSNIKGDFIHKVEVEKVNVKQNQTRKRV